MADGRVSVRGDRAAAGRAAAAGGNGRDVEPGQEHCLCEPLSVRHVRPDGRAAALGPPG